MPMLTVLMVHGPQLLQLLRRQHRSQLFVRALVDRMHLLVLVLRCQLLVLPQCLHLFIAAGKDRSQFRGLLRRQI